MFGDNPTRKLEHGNGDTLDIHSLFGTIQGEGPFAGRPATFIRLWGCHLACAFCDTDFESHRTNTPLDSIMSQVYTHGHRLVVLTGGEPMRQNILPLCRRLLQQGFEVQIETAGSFWIEGLEALLPERSAGPAVHIVVSPKTPAVHENMTIFAQHWKYLISHTDKTTDIGTPIMTTQVNGGKERAMAMPPSHGTVYLQPLDTGTRALNRLNEERCVQLALQYGHRVCLQQHKILGLP